MTAGRDQDSGPAASHPPSARGSTHVPAGVVSKIAAQAATEVAHIGPPAGGFAGMGSRRRLAGVPEVECELYGRAAVLRFDLGLDFPVPLERTLDELREHIVRRVNDLTGVYVARIDIDVSWLRPGAPARRIR